MNQQIENLKNIINLIEVDTDLDIKGERLSNAQNIINNMIFENDSKRGGYFISVNDIGPDNDFTRFYTVLEKMTRADAIKINKENSDDSSYYARYRDGIREVSKATYNLWYELAWYSEIVALSKRALTPMLQLSGIKLDLIKQMISKLRHRLGLNYKWQIVRLYHK